MKKICLIFCGGTMTMKRNVDGALAPYFTSRSLPAMVPQLDKLADITIMEIANVDSSNIGPEIWSKLAAMIQKRYDEYDGFVVTHGTDTMAYTASALSFVFHGKKKSIVFTGAQKPLEQIPSDATNNLINAVLIASRYEAGVVISFGPKILQGVRATKVSESSLDAFDAPMVSRLGEIALDINLTKRVIEHAKAYKEWHHTTFDSDILEIQIIPGLSSNYLISAMNAGCHGIILEGFGPGNVPESLIAFLHEADKRNIPVVILSQCRNGITQMQLYDVGARALKAGGIPGFDMTVEAASTKLMWALAKTKDIEKIRTVFKTNLSGEVTINE